MKYAQIPTLRLSQIHGAVLIEKKKTKIAVAAKTNATSSGSFFSQPNPFFTRRAPNQASATSASRMRTTQLHRKPSVPLRQQANTNKPSPTANAADNSKRLVSRDL